MTIENSTMPDAPEVEQDSESTETAPEAETQDNDPASETLESDGEAEQTEGEGDAEGEGDPEEIEIKVGGEILKVPKGAMPDEIRERVQKFVNSAEASYTSKFQEVAEARKAVEARAEAVQKLSGMNTELLETYSQGLAVRQQLEHLTRVDMNALWQSNPDQARQVSDTIAAKQAELQGIIQKVNATEQQFNAAQQAEIERQDAEGKALIERKIKGFSQRANEVIEYAVKEYGVDRKEAERYGLNPVAATAMYKAMLYDRMQAARTAKPKTTPAPAKPIAAVAKGGAAKPGKSVKDMSPSEMARHLGLPG